MNTIPVIREPLVLDKDVQALRDVIESLRKLDNEQGVIERILKAAAKFYGLTL